MEAYARIEASKRYKKWLHYMNLRMIMQVFAHRYKRRCDAHAKEQKLIACVRQIEYFMMVRKKIKTCRTHKQRIDMTIK